MYDVVSSAARGADTPTNSSETGKHRNDSAAAYTTIISFCKRYFDVAIVCVVIVGVWVLLALPTIFYHRPMKVTIYIYTCTPGVHVNRAYMVNNKMRTILG